MDAKLLQPLDRQWSWQVRQQHVGLAKITEDMLGNGSLLLPLDGILDEVLVEELAGGLLEAAVAFGVVWRREAAQVRRLREGDG